MTREEAKDLFRNDKDAYGKPRAIMHKIDQIFDAFEKPLPPAEGANLATREELIDLIIDHSTGATDNIADGVWYKLLADEILKRQSIPANNGIPTREENPKGLHQRYIVSKTDGEPVDDKAEYFVLRVDKNGNDPKHIAACRKAVIVYANAIKDHLPELSKDLIARYSDGEPTAEGAEEVQPTAYEWHNLKTGHCYVDYVPHLDAKEGYTKIPLYTALHAQRLAEKMVEEKLRGELIAYDKWTSKQGWGKWLDDNNSEKYVDEYLKSSMI